MTLQITITQQAEDYIKKVIEKNQGVGFRLSVKKTGCSGYAYLPTIVETINPNDQVMALQDGVSLYIDTAWLDLLQNLTIDYIDDNKSGLKQKKLVFTNPKEGDRCGCGESFNIDK